MYKVLFSIPPDKEPALLGRKEGIPRRRPMNKIDVKELLEKGAYFGHKVARTNPRSLPFTHKAQNGIYIIDLFKTKASIEAAMKMLFDAGRQGEQVLIVGTKRIIKTYLTEFCAKNNIFYMTEKWIGGFFTNFDEVHKNIKRANIHALQQKTGELNSMIKHQRVKLEKEINKILRVYKGALEMDKIPQVVVLIDIKKEKNALNEARKIQTQQTLEGKSSLRTVGIADTNANPFEVNYPIVVNDDSALALEYILSNLLEAYLEGRKAFTPKQEQTTVPEVKKEQKVEKKVVKPPKVIKRVKVTKKGVK